MTRIAVIIPSLGRSSIIAKLVVTLNDQTRPPELICVAVTKIEDAPARPDNHKTNVIIASIGSCAQRNAGLDHINGKADIVVFLDDDFVPSPSYFENVEQIFHERPDVAGVTGVVLKDGVKGPGLSFEEALAIIENHHMAPGSTAAYEKNRASLYGCNMAFRASAIEEARFDERLPLYGWLEDIDFSARAKTSGLLIKSGRLTGVHLGVKGGRTSGVRFGYSQIINPIYLCRKGTMTLHHATNNIGRNIFSNHARILAPEPDRRGRVKGNWLAIADIMRGRITPERIVKL